MPGMLDDCAEEGAWLEETDDKGIEESLRIKTFWRSVWRMVLAELGE